MPPDMPGEIQVTVDLKEASARTEQSIVQEGLLLGLAGIPYQPGKAG